MKKLFILLLISFLIAGFIGCTKNQADKKIDIGSKNLTENILIAEMYSLVLEYNGFEVEEKFALGTPTILHQSILNDEIDIYPEYTGTALMQILKKKPMTDDKKVYTTVKSLYKKDFNLIWLKQAPLNNTHAIVVRKDTKEKYNLENLTDLSKVADEFVIGAKPEFIQREDGLKALQKVYGGFEFKDVKAYNPGLRYKALVNNEIDTTVAFSTDGQIDVYNLAVLKDDKKVWPPYHIAPVVRENILEKYPEINELLNEVTKHLTDETMQQLNWKVDGEKMEYEEVARDFLTKKGLIERQ